jgi:hypothetical protein
MLNAEGNSAFSICKTPIAMVLSGLLRSPVGSAGHVLAIISS